MIEKILPEELLIGAHTSIAGGFHNAILQGREIGATTVQIFTANQRQWKTKPVTDEAAELFQKALQETGLSSITSHASYLMNLGSPDPIILHKSRKSFREEIERCLALGISFLNFHPGAALNDTRERCLDRIQESLLEVEDLFVDDSLRLLFETTAGQGTCVGSTFEEISYLVDKVKDRLPIGVCVDTCHIFAAGYDIRTPAAWMKTLQTFDDVIGLKHLYAFHLNDSLCGFDSRKDRHASIGEGVIGKEAFRFLMQHETLRLLPKYLETPEGPAVWDKEIWMLREFAK